MSINAYNSKVVISGDIVEIYEYHKPILEGFDIKSHHDCGRSFIALEEAQEINRDKVYNRAKRDIRRLINANVDEYSKFVTLTFKDNIIDVRQANYEFKKFKQRLQRHIKRKVLYLAVVEFQKRGAIHYHVLFFNIPYIKNKVLNDIWGNGFVKINKIDNCDNVGAYVCKYMTKTNDDRLKGEKMWFRSSGLDKPIEIKDKERVDNLIEALPSNALTYANTFENEYNSTLYKQYNMSKLKTTTT